MKKIAYTKPDGGLSVMIPVFNTFGEAEGFTEADAEQRAWDTLPKDAIEPRFVTDADIPTDRTFRNAWKNDLTVDMVKAREIHKDHLRRLRKPKMEALDVEFMRAVERGDAVAQAAIAAKKQALRDVTIDPRIMSAATPEELKAVMPDALK